MMNEKFLEQGFYINGGGGGMQGYILIWVINLN